jgi:hypothetical protein
LCFRPNAVRSPARRIDTWPILNKTTWIKCAKCEIMQEPADGGNFEGMKLFETNQNFTERSCNERLRERLGKFSSEKVSFKKSATSSYWICSCGAVFVIYASFNSPRQLSMQWNDLELIIKLLFLPRFVFLLPFIVHWLWRSFRPNRYARPRPRIQLFCWSLQKPRLRIFS